MYAKKCNIIKHDSLIFILLLLAAPLACGQADEEGDKEEIEGIIKKINDGNTLGNNEAESQRDALNRDHILLPRSWPEIFLSLGVLAFGLILVLTIIFIAMRNNIGWNREMTRLFVSIVTITGGLFLITAGYSDQQIAPMFALIGTMLGYIFGKSSSSERNQ